VTLVAVESLTSISVVPHPWTIDEYYRMADTGILKPGARVELIEGVIVDMSPIGDPHNSCVYRVNTFLHEKIGPGRVIVSVQAPIRLAGPSEPEPDVAVLRRRPDFYRRGKATAADVLLIIEVSDSSLEYDRQVKARLYAQAGILDYVIVNLVDDQVELHRDPTPEGYQTIEIARRGDTIRLVAFPDISIAVDDILG
jgi:Uma2 family endonuclease